MMRNLSVIIITIPKSCHIIILIIVKVIHTLNYKNPSNNDDIRRMNKWYWFYTNLKNLTQGAKRLYKIGNCHIHLRVSISEQIQKIDLEDDLEKKEVPPLSVAA
jgi:hypothetical protein